MKYKALFRTVIDHGYLEQQVCRSIAGTRTRFEPEFNKHAYIVNLIARAYDKNEGEPPAGGVPIRTKVDPVDVLIHPELKFGTLEHLFGGPRKFINKYINNLSRWGIIRLHTRQVAKVTSATWVFTEEYEKYPRSFQWFKGGKNSTIHKVAEMWMMKLNHPLVQAVQHIYDHHLTLCEEGIVYTRALLNHPNIDIIADALLGDYYDDNKEALQDLLKGVPVPTNAIHLVNFFMKSAYCKRLKKGKRLYGPFQLLPRVQRHFLRLDGRPLIEVDLVSSQPLFASVLLKKTWQELHPGDPCPQDLELFQQTCLKNIFYEVIAAAAGIELTEELRGQFKKDFFRECFYSRDYETKIKRKPIKDAFKRLYPETYKLMNRIKSPDYTRFAVRCQDMEAELMLYTVYKQLISEGVVCLPLHDAIYVSTPEHEKRAKALITEAFQKMHGITIQFKATTTKELSKQEFINFKKQYSL